MFVDARLTTILTVALLAATAWSYTTKYDNMDISPILTNERLLKKYIECLTHTDASKCTPDGKELRDTIPDALATECSKCTAPQRENAEKVIKFLRENKPEEFKKLVELYDPTGNYRKNYQARAEERGIAL